MSSSVIASLTIHCLPTDNQTPYLQVISQICKEYNLSYEIGPMSTIIEGEMSKILQAVLTCRDQIHSRGATKLEISLAISSRSDRPLTFESRMSKIA